jgi:hypothetical protein
MEFLINDDELNALCGLPHMQQLAYLRGVRPYMDVQTRLVGIKRGISYQSIAEQLYIEPHQGIKNESYSRAQVRRALSGLERAGLIQLQSQEMKLILKCNLASTPYSVQNKAVTKPSHQPVMEPLSQLTEIHESLSSETLKADIGKTAKADTPLKEDIYIYLLSQFEKFWSMYPEKKSRTNAWQAFQRLNPDPALFSTILNALEMQINNRETRQLNGIWVPPWKYPVNWLAQQCWQDEITIDITQETNRAERKTTTRHEPSRDMFCPPIDATNEQADECARNNVVQLQPYQQRNKTY